MAKKQTFDVEVEIVPLSGDKVRKTVTVPASSTVAEVAKAANIVLHKNNMFVDGKPAMPETRVTSASKLTITERPQGS